MSKKKGMESYKRAVFSNTAFLEFEAAKEIEKGLLCEGERELGSVIEEESEEKANSLKAIRLSRTFGFDNLRIKLHLGEEDDTGDATKSVGGNAREENNTAKEDGTVDSTGNTPRDTIGDGPGDSHPKDATSPTPTDPSLRDTTSPSPSDPPSESSLEFPDSCSTNTIDWNSMVPIIKFVQSMCTERKREPKKDPLDSTIFFDPKYLYFLKKVCGLSKKECVVYGKEQHKLLMDRANKSKAETVASKEYRAIEVPEGVIIEFEGVSIRLNKTKEIQPIELPTYVKDEFEYFVHKYGENVEMISSKTGVPLRDVILIYYLKYYNMPIEMRGSLLDKYVDEEWSMNDRIMFEENFSRHGTKFNKFMMNKSLEELKVYYRFFLKNYLPINWTVEERGHFARLIGTYKKDWEAMAGEFEGKDANDLRVFYGSYYKKLDEEEKAKEVLLGGGGESESMKGKKGRKSV